MSKVHKENLPNTGIPAQESHDLTPLDDAQLREVLGGQRLSLVRSYNLGGLSQGYNVGNLVSFRSWQVGVVWSSNN